MGSYRTKEEDVAKISTSVFITNFPESLSAKELFHSCKQYGHVVDSFIPTKRSKTGKRFGFVRFINVFNEERLVNNLCTVWIDRHKIHANIARFNRSPVKSSNTHSYRKENVNMKANGTYGGGRGSNSYVSVLKGDVQKGGGDLESVPAMVLDDECLVSRDLSKSLMGRVKEFTSLANLKRTLSNEGFVDIKIQYMGEFWVMLEFATEESMNLFRDNVSVGSWFSQIKSASMEFQTDRRIAWVEIEGIPFKLWSNNTFKSIAAKWGDLLDVDDQEETYFHSKRLCIHTKSDRSISEEFKIIHRGKLYWIRANETPGWVPDFVDDSDDEDQDDNIYNDDGSRDQEPGCFGGDSDVEGVPESLFEEVGQGDNNIEEASMDKNEDKSDDPFNIYPMLNKKTEMVGNDNKSDGSLKYPPGFTPIESIDTNPLQVEGDSNNNVEGLNECNRDEVNEVSRGSRLSMKFKDDGADSIFSGHFKKSEIPRTGGSILGLLDEVVKVGQVMGYKMEGCMSNMAEIIETQGAEEVYR